MRGSVIRRSKSCGCVQNHPSHATPKMIAAAKLAGEKRRDNLIGQRFSRLVVLEYADKDHQVYYNGIHKTTWKCQCDCGNICYVTSENLKRGDTPSCGCITKENQHARLKDLSGQKFGHLTVLKWLGTINKNSKYLVKCDCGKIYEVYANNLTQGSTTSCGCVKESHGEQKIREILGKNNITFINQKTFQDFKYKDTHGTPKFDFYLPKQNILIEYDGEQHFRPVFSFDTADHFKQRQKHDREKDEYCFSHDISLIRIPYIHYSDLKIEDLLSDSKYLLKGEEDARRYWEKAISLFS